MQTILSKTRQGKTFNLAYKARSCKSVCKYDKSKVRVVTWDVGVKAKVQVLQTHDIAY